MKTQKLLNKVFGLLIAVFMTFSVMVSGGVVHAQSGNTDCENSTLGQVFGCSGLLDGNGGINVGSIVQLVFRIILYAAILWTVWNVVLAGIKIAGAKEDADKRKEGIQAVINAVIGLVVALLAFGIVTTVANQITGGQGNFEVTTTPCTATNSAGQTFTGFVAADDANVCRLLAADGTVIYEGTISR